MKRKVFTSIKAKLKDCFDLIEEDNDHEAFEVWKDGKYFTHVKSSRGKNSFQEELIARNLFLSYTNLKRYEKCSYSNNKLLENAKKKGKWIE